MCGMFGCLIREGNAVTIITDGLKRLEYRGYDSIGVVMIESGELLLRKDAGHLEDVIKRLGIKGWLDRG